MKKDCTRDYVISAFRLYAKHGKPTYEQARKMIYDEACTKYAYINPELAVIKAEEAVEQSCPYLYDIDAVNRTIKLLHESNKDYIIKAVDAVYFFNPTELLHSNDITNRVRKFAQECPCDESSVYRWLKEARTLCAASRGLRTSEDESIYTSLKCI